MMTSIESYVRRGQARLRQWAGEPRVRMGAKIAGIFAAGFLLAAAPLANAPMPFAMALLLSMQGWQAALLAVGGSLGYLTLWGRAGLQGIAWLVLALPPALLGISKKDSLLPCAVGGLIVSAAGLAFSFWMPMQTPIGVYLLRVALGAAGVKLFQKVLCRGDPAADWMAQGIGVLALAQFTLFPGFNLGYIAAGALAAGGSFPAAALSGLALDVTGVSQTPITAVLCLAYLTRLLPMQKYQLYRAAPGVLYLLVMSLRGIADPLPAVGLCLGGAVSLLLPPVPKVSHRRGETGVAQVHLELMASALSQTQQLLLETREEKIDEEALLRRTRERACGSCPGRKTCQPEALDPRLLHTVLTDTASLPISCRKPGRMILELRRSQEQLRALRAERRRLQEYRGAVIQQYQFLSEFLRDQADLLPHRGTNPPIRFTPQVKIAAAGVERANGDRISCFPGTGCRYFVLLCDGCGTGLAAAQEGQSAGALLRQMLCSGFPAEYALRSLNSLLVLRDKPAATTADLCELHLDTGRCTVYKWGAAPSILLRQQSAERIGSPSAPPGIWMEEGRELMDRVSLRRGETLILCSDGVDTEQVLQRIGDAPRADGEALAEQVLRWGGEESCDDATVAVIRLMPA